MNGSSSTWVTRLDQGSGGIRVAVKDLVDVAGVPTTAGCRAVADRAQPAKSDAACLEGLRRAVDTGQAILVGKTNLHELALGISGVNPWFGTPINPADPRRVPGGSSSGSAAAVGSGEADVAIGTDTGGSVRIPAGCCGIAGLKTTFGRIPLTGVWPLAPSLDTVGPMARDTIGLATAMALLEPGFAPGRALEGPIGRLRALGPDGAVLVARPNIEASIDAALAAAGVEVVDIVVPGWLDAARAALQIIGAEASALHGHLVREHPGGVGQETAEALAQGARVGHQQLLGARSLARRWRDRLERDIFTRVAALALPVLDGLAPHLEGDLRSSLTVRWTAPINLAGLPALALPVPLRHAHQAEGEGGGAGGPLPAALQLVGPAGAEAGLLGLGARIEALGGAAGE